MIKQITCPPRPANAPNGAINPNGSPLSGLGVTLRQEQQRILKALRSHDLVAVQAPYGSGKTFAAAIAVIWWLMAHDQAIAITTAPSPQYPNNTPPHPSQSFAS